MTKNNLRQHLSWLLNRGPPQIPALQLSTWSDETTTATTVTSTTATFTISLDAQPNEYLPRTSAPSDHGKSVQRPAEVKVDNDGDIVIHDAEMARLQFAPSSTTKPRMLSCTKNGSSSIPSTPIARRVLENGGNKLDTLTRSSVKGSIAHAVSTFILN
jgi:bloom syndrome protein